MQLADSVRNYYYDHLDDLTADQQLHFFTRLGAWEGDERALSGLSNVKHLFAPGPHTPEALGTMLQNILDAHNPPVQGSVNALDLRMPYFEKYPTLRNMEKALARVRHLLVAYNIDARNALLDIVSREDLLHLKSALMQDTDALRILSTYAVNFVYTLERIVLKDYSPTAIDVDYLYNLRDGYDLSNPLHLQLFIYLYTHCVINESNFYTTEIPSELLPIYTRMVADLEDVIDKNFAAVNLDNKLEYLVCCRIVGYTPRLAVRIYNECEQSVSSQGTFLVDRHNTNVQADRVNLGTSEHRNVLFIMSCSTFTPHRLMA